jgi:hypothetical protein
VTRTEGGPRNVVFTLSVVGTVGALVTLISRRILLATLLVTAMVALLCTIAYVKQKTTDITLHAYDAVSLLTSWTSLGLLWHHQTQYAVGVLLMVIATAVLARTVLRIDASRVRRHYSFGAAVLFATLVVISADAREARRHMGFYYEHRHLWFFFSSWLETGEACGVDI